MVNEGFWISGYFHIYRIPISDKGCLQNLGRAKVIVDFDS